MNFRMFNVFLEKEAKGEINLATATIKVALLNDPVNQGGTDISTEEDVNNLAGFDGGNGLSTNMLEFDGMAYARATLANQAIVRDDNANTVKLTGDNVTFAGLDNDGMGYGVGGVLLIAHIDGTEANDYPIALLPYEKTPNGNDFVVKWPSTGILFKQQAAA